MNESSAQFEEGSARVLVAAGSPSETAHFLQLLADQDFGHFSALPANSLDEVLATLVDDRCELALVALEQPDSSGFETYARIALAAPELPLIVLAAAEDTELATRIMAAGAQDFLVKGNATKRVLVRVLRNALERHRLLTHIRAAQRRELDMKDQFLSQVSHELRTPLTAIYQFVTLLLDDCAGPLKPEQRELLDLSLANVERLKAMISDLLDLARSRSGKLSIEMEIVDAVDLVGRCVAAMKPLAMQKGITLEFRPLTPIPKVHADPDRATQILSNLIDNALKFTASGGQVRVELGREAPGFVRVSVSDTGCGISPQALTRIFERLYQERPHSDDGRKGLGLGLFISRELVEGQGGRIWVESVQGQGSRFHFTLSAASD